MRHAQTPEERELTMARDRADELERELMRATVAADAYLTALVKIKIQLEDELRERRRDRYVYQAYVRWSRLDAIRDAFAELGIDVAIPVDRKAGR
jgi:hypothetical protein